MKVHFESKTKNLGDQLCILRVIKEYYDSNPETIISVKGLPFYSLYENAELISQVVKDTGGITGLYNSIHTHLETNKTILFDLTHREIFCKYTSEGKHLIEAYAAQVPLIPIEIEPYICFDQEPYLKNAKETIKRPAIAIAAHSPTCLSNVRPGHVPNKEWPETRWKEFIGMIPKEYSIYEFGARNEKQLSADGNVIPIYGHDLRYVAMLISECDVFVGLDNGLAHLARAVGQKNIIQIYGDHVPLSWASYKGNHIVNGKNILQITTEEVYSTLMKVIK